MELSINAFFAQDLFPLRRYFEQSDRRNLKKARPAARLPEPFRYPPGDDPFTERNAQDVPSRTHGSRPHVQRDCSPAWRGSKDEITIAVLALDTYNARVYRDMLEVRGYSSVTAQDISDWFAVLGDCEPDLILIDLWSSNHPSIDVARAIMAEPRYRDVPTIIVTDAYNSGDLNDPTRLIAGCDGRIAKPVSVDGFYRPIEAALKHSTGRRAIQQ